MKAAARALASGRRIRHCESGGVAHGSGRLAPSDRAGCPGGRAAIPGCRGRARAGLEARDLPAPPSESFRAWWRRTGGGGHRDRARRHPRSSPVGAPAGVRRPTGRCRAIPRRVGVAGRPARPVRRAGCRLPRRGRAVLLPTTSRRASLSSCAVGGVRSSRPTCRGPCPAPSSTSGHEPRGAGPARRCRHRRRGRRSPHRHGRARPRARPGTPRALPRPRPARLRGPADQVVAGRPRGAIARLDPHRPQTWISGPSAPPATSSSTGSKASTAPANSRSCWRRIDVNLYRVG